jgi:CRISPR-associated Csx2 family protein
MSHTLVTFLGRGRDALQSSYRETTYRFADGRRCTTSFFGLALAEHLRCDRLVVLGTRSSMWGVLVEHAAAVGEEEETRIALMEAEAVGQVDQRLLDALTGVLRKAAGRQVAARLIPFGRTDGEQRDILETISAVVGDDDVSFDLTHGFRHLGMVSMLSAFMLERIGRVRVRSLWYGALDMSEDGFAPVLRLDGLNAIERWVGALNRFDASGDYGVFAPLLEADGVPPDKARCLSEAAFFERTFNLSDAARKLRTIRAAIGGPLPGSSGLFRVKLLDRLGWIDEQDLSAQQRKLALQYLGRNDFVRAAVFAWEALVSAACVGYDWHNRETRETAAKALEEKIKDPDCDPALADAYRTIRTLRNALAHGTPPQDDRFRKLLASPERLRTALERALDCLIAVGGGSPSRKVGRAAQAGAS